MLLLIVPSSSVISHAVITLARGCTESDRMTWRRQKTRTYLGAVCSGTDRTGIGRTDSAGHVECVVNDC